MKGRYSELAHLSFDQLTARARMHLEDSFADIRPIALANEGRSIAAERSGPDPIQPGQDWSTLPRQLNSEQARAWLGLSRRQWFRVRAKREIREAVVFGTAGGGLKFWTVKLRLLVPEPVAAN